jgi:1-acyl-sn-glycerol-3-phosphate acyltransferase
MSLDTDTAAPRPVDRQPSTLLSTATSLRDVYLRGYHRHAIEVDVTIPDTPVLFVANHGFGGLVDLNALALARVVKHAGVQRPTTSLVHHIAWTLGAGRFVESIGGRPASSENAEAAFRDGHNVAVFPGGDVDAGKSWRDRDRIVFDGRSGFARLAINAGVPIVPIVTAGAGESLFVLSDGRSIARTLQFPKLLRAKALPISFSLGWGLNIGMAGILPYVNLPTKLHTAVLAPMQAADGESPEAFAARVQADMQDRLDLLVENRRPVIG